MIGLDTNVLVRYIVQDDPRQSAIATKFIEKECTAERPGFVSQIVLVELIWVCEDCYGASRREIAEIARRILSATQLAVQDAESVWKALRQFESGPADFADCLIERIARENGCESVATFDKAAARSGMRLLKG